MMCLILVITLFNKLSVNYFILVEFKDLFDLLIALEMCTYYNYLFIFLLRFYFRLFLWTYLIQKCKITLIKLLIIQYFFALKKCERIEIRTGSLFGDILTDILKYIIIIIFETEKIKLYLSYVVYFHLIVFISKYFRENWFFLIG